jgi:DHA1 family inner membrane transport protein
MGIGSIVAVGIVPANRRASAVALMWAGIASANILGVPAGTALGHAYGWRSTFWAIAALGTVAAICIAIWLPKSGGAVQTKLASEFKVLGRPQVLLTLGLSVFICAATFTVFTYIAPILLEVTGLAPTALPLYLLLFGVGGVIGMQLGGRLGDRNLMATLVAVFACNIVVFLILQFALHMSGPALAMMFVWGFFFYSGASPLQLRLIETARDAPNLAATVIQSTFNLGIALGPFVGALVLSGGLGFAFLPVCAAALAAAGLAVAIASTALERRARATTAL